MTFQFLTYRGFQKNAQPKNVLTVEYDLHKSKIVPRFSQKIKDVSLGI